MDFQRQVGHLAGETYLALRNRDAPPPTPDRRGGDGFERQLDRLLGDPHLDSLGRGDPTATNDRQLRETVVYQALELVAPENIRALRRYTLELQRLGVELHRRVEAHPRQLQR